MTPAWKSFEHYVVGVLKRWGWSARRTTSGRQGQETNADIDAQRHGIEFAIECKQSTRTTSSIRLRREWFDQVEAAAAKGNRLPILVFNFYRSGLVWCIRGDKFGRLIETMYEAGYGDGLADKEKIGSAGDAK